MGAAQTLTVDLSRQDFVEWLSPPDPSVNYNIARDTHHTGTALWFTESSTFRNWKVSGSLLWVYGKRTFFGSLQLRFSITDFQFQLAQAKASLRELPDKTHFLLAFNVIIYC